MVWGRVIAAAFAFFALAGCEELPFGLEATATGEAASAPEAPKVKGTREVTVTRNNVRLRGPDGFCVDPQQTRDRRGEAFVVFGNCAAITGNPEEPQPYLRGFATALVTGAGLAGEGAIAPQAETLRDFLVSRDGRAVLARDGSAESVTILGSRVDAGAVFVHVRDESPAEIENAQPSYWRGYFDAGNAVVAMSVIGFKDAPLEPSLGLSTLREFTALNRIRPANPLPGVAPAPVDATPGASAEGG